MFRNIFDSTPIYGYVPKEKVRFCDIELFGDDSHKYSVLKKIKLWHGTLKANGEEERLNQKIIIGIQCTYYDVINGKYMQTEPHCGNLKVEDIESKELELKEDDYFTKFYIGFNTYITHIKLITKGGMIIESGEEIDINEKSPLLNLEKEPQIIHSFTGYYNKYGITALGCKYLSRKDFNKVRMLGILSLRYFFKINEHEKKRWNNEEELNKLPLEMKAIAKLCLLDEEKLVIKIMKFYISNELL